MASVLNSEEAQPIDLPKVNDGHNTLQGYVLKRRIRYANMLPCFPPVWNKRYIVLRGKYIFRFTQENENKTKGSPIPVDKVTIEILDSAYDEDGELVPFCFCLSNIRKQYFFAADSKEERDRWVVEVQKAKEKAIKQTLGHARIETWEKQSNNLGEKLYDRSVKKENMDRDNCAGVGFY